VSNSIVYRAPILNRTCPDLPASVLIVSVDGAIGLDRLLRLARQAVLAGLRQSQEFAIAAADVSTAAV
jgi:hypothetical protein